MISFSLKTSNAYLSAEVFLKERKEREGKRSEGKGRGDVYTYVCGSYMVYILRLRRQKMMNQ